MSCLRYMERVVLKLFIYLFIFKSVGRIFVLNKFNSCNIELVL